MRHCGASAPPALRQRQASARAHPVPLSGFSIVDSAPPTGLRATGPAPPAPRRHRWAGQQRRCRWDSLSPVRAPAVWCGAQALGRTSLVEGTLSGKLGRNSAAPPDWERASGVGRRRRARVGCGKHSVFGPDGTESCISGCWS